MIAFRLVALFGSCLLPLSSPVANASGHAAPKLVVVIVIDQLPAAILSKLERHFSTGGFRRLMDEGVWFQQAYYPQAATLTGVGHAMIATGGLPAGHGIPGNDWYDRETDRAVYCVEDRTHRWVGGTGKPEDGTSPRNQTSTTFGDEWVIARNFQPRVIGISLKDRGSILLAGRCGKAFWYDSATGHFVSSTYYYPDSKLPAWVDSFNGARPADRYFKRTWETLLQPEHYGAAADDRAYEIDMKGLGRTFPHVIGQGLSKPDPDFYKAFATTPQANQFTLDFARAAIQAEQLGSRGIADMLVLSLTANDYCGHTFGPESLEYADMTLQTDRQLEAFFADLDRLIGLEHTMIVLSSDHGASPTPEFLTEQGIVVGRIDPDEIARRADSALDKAFGEADWAVKFLNPGLFLRAAPMKQFTVRADAVERVAAEAVRQIPGVAAVFTRTQLAQRQVSATELARLATATFHPERSPDVIILQEPYWYLYKDMKKNAGMHGSPYPYDTHVPVFFYGPGIRAGRPTRRVHLTSVAPTISAYLGVPAPSASDAAAFQEVLGN